jgi:Domain of unknown function (DUF5658)
MRSATRLSTPASIDRISPAGNGAHEARSIPLGALAWTSLAVCVFLIIQALLAAYNISATREAIARGDWEASPYDHLTVLPRLFPMGIAGMIAFVSLCVGGSATASRGHRILFALPGIANVLASVAVSPHLPQPIGSQWQLACFDWNVTYTTCSMPWFGHPWLGPSADVAALLVPGWFVSRRAKPRRWPGAVDRATMASILTSASVVATAVWAMVVVQNGVEIRAVAAVAALGLVLGAARPWWPWLHMLIAVALASGFECLLYKLFWPDPAFPLSSAIPHILGDTWPIVAVGLIASAWQPLAWLIRRLQDRPVRTVVAVNVLNVADAVLTYLAVRSGGAFESNPFVRIAVLPVKIAFVGALTWLMYRWKPSALVWPLAALVWVVGYHVAGIFVNAWH